MDTELKNALMELLPPTFKIRQVDQLSGGIITLGNLRNIQSQHPELGVLPVRYVGSVAVFIRQELLDWLEVYDGNFESIQYGKVTRRVIRKSASAEGSVGRADQGVEGTGGGSEGASDK